MAIEGCSWNLKGAVRDRDLKYLGAQFVTLTIIQSLSRWCHSATFKDYDTWLLLQ